MSDIVTHVFPEDYDVLVSGSLVDLFRPLALDGSVIGAHFMKTHSCLHTLSDLRASDRFVLQVRFYFSIACV